MSSRLLRGHVLDMLRELPDESVQCVVTSPPYWALRRYDIADVVFGGDANCAHDFAAIRAPWANGIPGPNGAVKNRVDESQNVGKTAGAFCACGAWRGQLGQEPIPELFIAHLVDIFREVRRVLRSDGTLWLNMGDCYATGAGGVGNCPGGGRQGEAWKERAAMTSPNRLRLDGLKAKDLVGIPWMLAFALRADGWYLRSQIVWAKGVSFCESYAGSVMPESVTDRPTRSHEEVFLLTKSERYFYDHEAVKERGVYPAGTRAAKGSGTREGNRRGTKGKALKVAGDRNDQQEPSADGGIGYANYDGLRNLRTVWAIGVEPFEEAHFATYPPDLVVPCVKAGTSAKGACSACGAPWKRVVEYEPMPEEIRQQFEAARQRTGDDHGRDDGFTTRRPNYQRKRIGETWQPTCECGTANVVPCVVLDPFNGSGSTGVACELLLRDYIGIDLGESYIEMANRRVGGVAPLFSAVVNS